MLTLFVASGNIFKLRDFVTAAYAEGVDVNPVPNIAYIPAPEENAATFEGNARDKAVYYSRFAPGEIVIADDSGLEVDALEGAPGVRSARYAVDAKLAGQPSALESTVFQIDRANNELLLKNLAATANSVRCARYRCVLAAARDGEVLVTAAGSVEGRILDAPRGTGGFGYDPIFYLPELDKTMAEIGMETKHQLSHRGKAFRSLLEKLMRHQP